MNILFASSEVAPFAKSGGLADVAGSLPPHLQSDGFKTAVIMPKYSSISPEFGEKMEFVCEFIVKLAWRNIYCGLFRMVYKKVTYYFIDNEFYFSRENLYGYGDDAERFAFFSKAVLEAIPFMEDFTPRVIHCNDWHTALLPVFLKELYQDKAPWQGIKTVYSIHNIKYQGNFEKLLMGSLLDLHYSKTAWDVLEMHDRLNFMKGGILCADKVTTVSETYAQEIRGDFFSEGLGEIINMRGGDLYGILNGIESKKQSFAAETSDGEKSVDLEKLLEYKAKQKKKLQKQMNLPLQPDVPIFALVSRFVEQKGIDLILGIMHEAARLDVQFLFLGTGESRYEDALRYFEFLYPGKVRTYFGFDVKLADLVYQGADFFLMPSLFEPCGLSQMMSMEYGTLPIVRETGGLRDSVAPYNEFTGEGTGFSFANYNAHELLYQIENAHDIYNKKALHNQLVYNAACQDFSWDVSAKKYMELYRSLV